MNLRLALAVAFVLATIVLYAGRYYWFGAATLAAASITFGLWWSKRTDTR